MITRSISALLFISLFYGPVSIAADQDRAENLKAAVSKSFDDLFTKKVREKLSDAGIAKMDSDRIIKNLVANSASCVVDALVQQAEEQSIDTDKLLEEAEVALGDEKGSEEFLEVLNEDELERKMESCLLTAFENAGDQFRL